MAGEAFPEKATTNSSIIKLRSNPRRKHTQTAKREALAIVSQAKAKEEIVGSIFKDPEVKPELKIFLR